MAISYITGGGSDGVPSPIGNAGKYLTNDGGQALWSPGGNRTLLGTVTATGTTLTFNNISQDYKDLYVYGEKLNCASGTDSIGLRVNNVAVASSYITSSTTYANSTVNNSASTVAVSGYLTTATDASYFLHIMNYANTLKTVKIWRSMSMGRGVQFYHNNGAFTTTDTAHDGIANITSLTFYCGNGFASGTFYLYGVK